MARPSKKPKARRASRSRKAKKPRLYSRYDPVTGEKVRVTRDDPRFDEWSSRKASKKTRAARLKREDPLAYARTFGLEAVKKRAERQATVTGGRIAKTVAPALVAGARAALASPIVQAAGAVGLIGAAIYAMQKIGERMDRSDGEKINAISLQFAHTQSEVAKQYGGKWANVPEDVRTKLVNGYKKAISDVTAYRRGTLRPSLAIPYGR